MTDLTKGEIDATRASLTLDDLRASAERNRQWGRWGEDDEIGTLNHVTPEMIVEAAKLVRKGKCFGLALPFDLNGPQRTGSGTPRFNPVHTMFRSGCDEYSPHAVDRGGFKGADDMVTMPLQCGTQWDGLGHVFYEGKMWNGYDARLVSGLGAAKNGIEKTRDRMTGRGVLLDIPRHLGLPWLPDGYGVGVELIEACAKAEGIKVGKGDFVMVRTGQLDRCLEQGSWGEYAGGDAPGLRFDTLDWLRESDIAALATDTWGFEVRPNEVKNARQPMHWIVIPLIGLTVGEIFRFKDLADDCAEDGVYEFFFCGASLPFTGAVGTPLNPMAIK